MIHVGRKDGGALWDHSYPSPLIRYKERRHMKKETDCGEGNHEKQLKDEKQ